MTRWLEQDQIHAIHEVVIKAGLERAALLSGLDPHLKATLPSDARRDQQMLLDLNNLNQAETLADGTASNLDS